MRKNLSRIIVNGGVLSPAELQTIIEAAEKSGLKTISFGSRQDILFPQDVEVNSEYINDLKLVAPDESGHENIVSSYVSSGLFSTTQWLTGDRYLYILEQFREQPDLKVNITDPNQRLVPLFTGHLNFIASTHEDYWFLYIRLPAWETMQMYPVLIYSWDIAKIAYAIESILQEEPETTQMIFDLVIDAIEMNSRTIDQSLIIPFKPFPYYEGMNRMGTDKYWLGLYWRNNRYDIRFLKEMCTLCAACKIGKISITPWKSFIIKGIPKEFKLQWERFLGISGINVRHSLLELNWHLPVNNEEAVALKDFLVNAFNKQDISTYGLTFGITDYTRKAYYFTAIVIEKNAPITQLLDFKIRDTFNLLYAKDFDPNTQIYKVHAQDVDIHELAGLLMELSRIYFEQLGVATIEEPSQKLKELKLEVTVHQCTACKTIYDPEFGDTVNQIPPKTSFENLPQSYVCSLCESGKESFEKIVVTKAKSK